MSRRCSRCLAHFGACSRTALRVNSEAITRINEVVDAARELVGEWLVRGETLRRTEVIEVTRALSRVSGTLLRNSATHHRTSFEQGLRRLGFSSLCLGMFEEPGRASEQCFCIAAFEASGRLRTQTHFNSSDFAAPKVFEQERRPVVVQALASPVGLLAAPLGHLHPSLYEQMREMLEIGLRGFRLARASAEKRA